MCKFVSWIEYEGNNYFLESKDLLTGEGKKLLKPNVRNDLCGHGAIVSYYPELKDKGEHKECSDFGSPYTFPADIVTAIKAGRLSNIGICLDVLNDRGRAEYVKIVNSARAEYVKIVNSASAEYIKIVNPASAKYEKIVNPASAKYVKIVNSASAKYEKIRNSTFCSVVKQKTYRNDNWK